MRIHRSWYRFFEQSCYCTVVLLIRMVGADGKIENARLSFIAYRLTCKPAVDAQGKNVHLPLVFLCLLSLRFRIGCFFIRTAIRSHRFLPLDNTSS